MKKLWLLALLGGLGCGLPAAAQVQDGMRYWGGTVRLDGEVKSSRGESDNQSSTTNQHSITPELQWGKFTNATTMIGLGARYGLSWNKNVDEYNSTSSYRSSTIGQSITLLPFVRKYKPLGERWAVFLHAEIGPSYNWSKTKVAPNSENFGKRHNWQYELSVKPGLVYFLKKKNLAIESYANLLALNASYQRFPDDSGRQIGFSTGLSTGFPSYFEIRLAKYIPAKTN